MMPLLNPPGFNGRNQGLSINFSQGSLGVFTDTRAAWSGTGAAAGSGTVKDWENVVRTAGTNEARFQGLWRSANLFAAPTSTLSTRTVTVPAGQFQCQFTGTGTITFSGVFSGTLVGQGANTIVAFNSPITCTAGGLVCTVSGSVTLAMLENVTGQSNTNPGPYIDANVAYDGQTAKGVRYYANQNGNTVTSNVVTAGTGAAITGGQLLVEPNAATNYFLQSDAPATQTSGTLGTGTYTLWMDGTGTVAVVGGTATITGAGTASSGTNVTFTVTVAGTVVLTVVGSPTRVQVENFTTRSSYIPTTTGAVTRAADAFTTPTSGLLLAANGSVAMAFTPLSAVAAGGEFLTLDNGVTGLVAMWAPATTKLASYLRSSSTEIDFLTSVSYPVNTPTKIACAWSGAAINVAKDGVAGTQGAYTAQTFATNVTLMRANGGSSPGPNALISSLSFNTVTPANVQTATV